MVSLKHAVIAGVTLLLISCQPVENDLCNKHADICAAFEQQPELQLIISLMDAQSKPDFTEYLKGLDIEIVVNFKHTAQYVVAVNQQQANYLSQHKGIKTVNLNNRNVME